MHIAGMLAEVCHGCTYESVIQHSMMLRTRNVSLSLGCLFVVASRQKKSNSDVAHNPQAWIAR